MIFYGARDLMDDPRRPPRAWLADAAGLVLTVFNVAVWSVLLWALFGS